VEFGEPGADAGAHVDMTQARVALAKETKAKGCWQAYGDVVPEWFDLYVGGRSGTSPKTCVLLGWLGY
jgi:hypothetical protein